MMAIGRVPTPTSVCRALGEVLGFCWRIRGSFALSDYNRARWNFHTYLLCSVTEASSQICARPNQELCKDMGEAIREGFLEGEEMLSQGSVTSIGQAGGEWRAC